MKKKKFTEEEKEILLRNPFISSVGEVSVFYTEESRQKALEEYFNSKSAKQIFIDVGIDLNSIGPKMRRTICMNGKKKLIYIVMKSI